MAEQSKAVRRPVESLEGLVDQMERSERWSGTDYAQAVEALALCDMILGVEKAIRDLEVVLVDLLGRRT